MRILFLLFLLPTLAFSNVDDRERFLSAWEGYQESSELVEKFEKIEEGKYHIKFKNLPYEGDLLLLAYDVEDIDYWPDGSVFTKTGYVEFEASGSLDQIIQKYSRTYYKWAQDNVLYYDSESDVWVTTRDYLSALEHNPASTGEGIFIAIFEYWSYALIVIILYFLWSTVVNNSRAKLAIKNQEEMLTRSFALSEESLRLQKQSMQESLELHKDTNKYLMEILGEIRDGRG